MSEILEKTRQDLEWDRLQQAVAGRCRGPLRDRLALELASSSDQMRADLAETGEAAALLSDGEPLPLDGLREIGEHLRRLERGGGLGGPALADIMSVLGAGRLLRAFLSEHKAAAPNLNAACRVDPVLVGLWERLRAALEPDGSLTEDASEELRRLHGEVRRLRERIVKKLEEIIRKQAALLQDNLYTIREGRYVLPVRRDAQPRLQGIVHGFSASGVTVFLEPSAVIELGELMETARQQNQALQAERAELAQARRSTEQRLAELRERDRRALSREARKLLEEVQAAREELARARAVLKKGRLVKPGELARAEEQIGQAAARVALGGKLEPAVLNAREEPPLEGVTERDLRAGSAVYVPYLRSEGVVVEEPQRGRVRVAVGSIKLWVESETLRRLSPGKKKADRKPSSPAAGRSDLLPPARLAEPLDMRTRDNTLDVRGMRVEEAFGTVDRFVDQLFRGSIAVGFIVHGHGTGALRDAVRERLRTELPYVLSVEPAPFEQGGDAVTVFRLDT